MRTLILMRHAKSDWTQGDRTDHDRPLNPRGRRAAPLMAGQLLSHGISVDIILASSAVRVQQTLELLQESWATETAVSTERDLYLATPAELKQHVDALHDTWQSAMIIGHNPGLSLFASMLCDDDVELPTAAVVILQSAADSWHSSLTQQPWHLVDYWKPRDLEAG
ncbi:SixA phosphatase family protein [Aureliella helgolandensis]|uniref:Phosphohistidine phosphatase n=1 Tax=Aureliella helgolandensis TaxID=2527968 RepID=A0A518G1G7_9BACT|nr:histidine phosphatase family protein [Aureliella helgolandensis]QDV22442.1 phosphohistidine phosphatase [Aureliella helgolandensis]